MNISQSGENSIDCAVPKFFSSILIIFGLFIIAQNILMIFILWRTPRLQTNANIFVLSLGVMDMIIGVDIINVGIFELLWGSSWPFRCLYPLMGGGSLGLIMGSFLHMGIIAVDRHTYIAQPFFYIRHCNKMVVCKVIAVVWLVILTLCFMPLLMSDPDYNACIIRSLPRLYKIYISSPLTYTVLLITCAAYLRIAVLSIRQRKAIASTASGLRTNHIDVPHQIEVNRSGLMKSIRFFIVMFGFFFLFSVPPMICTTVMQYHNFSETVFSAILLLVPLNSMTNFFINYAMNNDFRSACKKVIRDLLSHSCPQKIL